MNKTTILIFSLFLAGCVHPQHPYGLTKLRDGGYGAAVKNSEDFQNIITKNGCGPIPCRFDDLELTTVVQIGKMTAVITQKNARSNKEFMKFIGCGKKFVCATDGKAVYVGDHR